MIKLVQHAKEIAEWYSMFGCVVNCQLCLLCICNPPGCMYLSSNVVSERHHFVSPIHILMHDTTTT